MARKKTNPKSGSRGSFPGDELLARLAAFLKKEGVSYVVIGGQAVNQHGHHRFTRDIDFTIDVGPWEASRIIRLAKAAGLRINVKNPEALVDETQVLPCWDAVAQMGVDFSFVPSDYVRQTIKRAVRHRIAGQLVAFLSVEDLIVQKTIANRPQDRIDVIELTVRHSRLDRRYIRDWLTEFEAVLDEQLVTRFEQLMEESEER